MCVFSVAYRAIPGCPVFVLTNRDESTRRPTLRPRVFAEPAGRTRWFGPADGQAGGTWLGVNDHGLLAAITNRKKDELPANPRSRGLLCRDVLGCTHASEAIDFVFGELKRHAYAGFNLILLSDESAHVIEAVESPLVTRLDPGIHTIGNRSLSARDDARVNATQVLAENLIRGSHDPRTLVEGAKAICRLHAGEESPAICLHGDGWGTVGSTVVALTDDCRESAFHYAPGPPCRTPFEDESRRFVAMRCSSRHSNG